MKAFSSSSTMRAKGSLNLGSVGFRICVMSANWLASRLPTSCRADRGQLSSMYVLRMSLVMSVACRMNSSLCSWSLSCLYRTARFACATENTHSWIFWALQISMISSKYWRARVYCLNRSDTRAILFRKQAQAVDMRSECTLALKVLDANRQNSDRVTVQPGRSSSLVDVNISTIQRPSAISMKKQLSSFRRCRCMALQSFCRRNTTSLLNEAPLQWLVAMHSWRTASRGVGSDTSGRRNDSTCTDRRPSSNLRLRYSLITTFNQEQYAPNILCSQGAGYIFIMAHLQPKYAGNTKQSFLKEFAPSSKRPSRQIRVLHSPVPIILAPTVRLASEQREESPRGLSPLQKLRQIRDKMYRGSSRRMSSNDSYATKSYTLQLCGEVNPEASSNNLFERQIGTEHSMNSESDLNNHGKLISKYFKQITSRAPKSVEGRPKSPGRSGSSLRWLKEEKRKLNIVEPQDKNEVTKKRKATETKQNVLQGFSGKYQTWEQQKPTSAPTPLRINSAKGVVEKLIQRAPSEKLSHFKQLKSRRRVQQQQQQIELKPWDIAKDDYYSFF